MQKIVPFLWFNGQAEEAVSFYLSIFKRSKIVHVMRCGEAGPGPKGSVLTINFQLEGQDFIALNGSGEFAFSPAISLFVKCADQREVDRLWNRLLKGGKKWQCGWLHDKFGVTWQIVPTILLDLIQDKDAAKSARVMKAMMKMTKIEIAKLKRAAKGRR